MKFLNLLAATSAVAQLEESIVDTGSARPARAKKPETSFDKDPTDGVRPCNYYTFVAEADFSVGAGPANGKITFTQSSCKESGVKINGLLSLKGKMNGKKKFGWHIHEFGSTANGCGPSETGGHFNPFNSPVGHWEKSRRHREVGQIGNLSCENGKCYVNQVDKVIRLHGLSNIIGRSVVIHAKEELEDGTGSGDRIACATIVWADQKINENY